MAMIRIISDPTHVLDYHIFSVYDSYKLDASWAHPNAADALKPPRSNTDALKEMLAHPTQYG